jgi:ArsR family transcriptional regulator, zinc-responsive transcriptional repressor
VGRGENVSVAMSRGNFAPYLPAADEHLSIEARLGNPTALIGYVKTGTQCQLWGYPTVTARIIMDICTINHMKKISYEKFFKALSGRSRLGIVGALRKGPKNVTQLCRATGMEQSRVSHSLALLSAWGFVSSRRDGKSVVYSLDGEHIIPMLASIDGHLSKFEPKLLGCGILKGGGTCPHMKEGKNG